MTTRTSPNPIDTILSSATPAERLAAEAQVRAEKAAFDARIARLDALIAAVESGDAEAAVAANEELLSFVRSGK